MITSIGEKYGYKVTFQYILIGIFAFLPLSHPFCSLFIILGTVVSIVNLSPERLKQMLPYGILMLTLGYSMIYSPSPAQGWKSIETKLSLLATPIIFSNRIWDEWWDRLLSLIKVTFIVSCSVAALICTTYALYRFNIHGDAEFLYKKNYSILMHNGYFALYNIWAAYLLFKTSTRTHLQKGLRIFSFLIMLSAIMLCSTRISLLALIFVVGLEAYLQVKRNGSYRVLKIALPSTIVLVAGILFFSPKTKMKFEAFFSSIANPSEIDKNSSNRFLTFYGTFQCLKERPVWGAGIGNTKAVLKEKYKELGYKKLAEHSNDPHNQFLQSYLSSGLIGLLGFIYFVVYHFRCALLDRRNSDYLTFSFLLLVYAMIESILQVQAGTLFFAAWLGLLLATYRNSAETKVQV